MDVRLLELFVGVAEEGSIHGGARRLMIAQPAVSKGLQRLERTVGTPLVARSHRGIELTAAGAALLIEAREILKHIDSAVEVVKAAGKTQTSVTIGLIAGALAAGDITTDIISAYKRQRPDVEVRLRELSFAEQFDAVASREVDVALVRSPYSDDRLELHRLFDEPMVMCCNHDHRRAKASELTVEEILDEPMLDLGDAPKEWADFWHFTDSRGGPARLGSAQAETVSQMQVAVAFSDIMTPVVQSVWRLGMGHADLRGIPLVDSPRSEVVIARRSTDTRSEVTDFVTCAEVATRDEIGRVAGANLLC